MSSAASAHRAKLASLVGKPLNPHITGSSNLHRNIIINNKTHVKFKYDSVTYISRLYNIRGPTERGFSHYRVLKWFINISHPPNGTFPFC